VRPGHRTHEPALLVEVNGLGVKSRDVYGEESFPPERAQEVFVPEVLDGDGRSEKAVADALRSGRAVLVG
jgi:hypothetical protein